MSKTQPTRQDLLLQALKARLHFKQEMALVRKLSLDLGFITGNVTKYNYTLHEIEQLSNDIEMFKCITDTKRLTHALQQHI